MGVLVAFLRILAVLARQFRLVIGNTAAVAVVGFVVDDDDVLLVAQFAAHPANHLVRRFSKRAVAAVRQQALGQLAGLDPLAQQEGMEVGDDDLRLTQ